MEVSSFSQQEVDCAAGQLAMWVDAHGGRIRVNDLGLFYSQHPQWKGIFNGRLRQLCQPPLLLFTLPDAATLELRRRSTVALAPPPPPPPRKRFFSCPDEFKRALDAWQAGPAGPIQVLGVDIKGDIRGDGTISFVQIALGGKEECCLLIDVLMRNAQHVLDRCGVRALLEDSTVLKVMHDSAKPAAALHNLAHCTLVNVWDTHTAFEVLLKRMQIADQFRARGVVQVMNYFGVKYHGQSKPECREGWFRRPLMAEQIDYAGEGVVHLPGRVLERMVGLASELNLVLQCKQESERHMNSLRVANVSPVLTSTSASLFQPINASWDQCKHQVDEKDMEKWFAL